MSLRIIPFFILLFILPPTFLEASHIFGGYMTYSFVENDTDSLSTIDCTMRLFREVLSGGADFDNQIEIGVYRKLSNGEYAFEYKKYVDSLDNFQRYPVEDFNLSLLESKDYRFELDLVKGHDYLIAYQRCCRMIVLNNLMNPNETGFVIQTEITSNALSLEIDSPTIQDLPLSYVRVGEPIEHSLDIQYADSTELRMEYIAPLSAGGTFDATGTGVGGCCDCVRPDPDSCHPPFDQVVFGNDYTSSLPFGSQNNLDLDPINFNFKGSFEALGTYCYGVLVSHYHEGQLLSNQILDHTLYAYIETNTDDVSIDTEYIYPNPNSGIFSISKALHHFTVYEVIDSHGKLIKSGSLDDLISIQLNLSEGAYILKLTNEYRTENSLHKIIIKK